MAAVPALSTPVAAAQATAPPANASPAVSGVKTQSPGPVTTAIYSASASPPVVHAGQTVTWVVATSSDVTDVQAAVSVYHFSLARAGAGRFVLSFSVPADVPPFFHGHYDVQLTAHGNGSASGALAVDFE